MRDVPHIWEAWRSGRYFGDYKPSTRVTVEKSFELRTTDPVLGRWKKGPARWFQRSTVDRQVETEIPNILNVSHETSIDSDAGTCDIVVLNMVMPELGLQGPDPAQWGTPGAFTWDMGASQDAVARWAHAKNDWFGVLVPNALIRIYQGYGGEDKTIREAVADGNLVLNGVYLLDEVSISTEGTIHLRGRNMAKLLVDQQLYPPLVPRNEYPLKYCRYTYKNFVIPPDPKPAVNHQILTQTSEYATCGDGPFSSLDEFMGETNSNATGHPATDSLDWSFDHPPNAGPGQIKHQDSYWLSEPKGSAGDTVWIEYCCGAMDVNLLYLHTYAGNYRALVSVYENGEWVAPEVPGRGGVTPQGIPYVTSFNLNWEGGWPPGTDPNAYWLPRTYRMSRVRLTFTNLSAVPEGGYRAGLRKFVALYDHTAATYPPLSFACAAYPYNMENRTGYWQVRSNGKIYAFGDARTHENSSWNRRDFRYPIVAMNAAPDGEGYWVMDYSGHMESYGSAQYYGDPDQDGQGVLDLIDFTVNAAGDGYWVLHKDGTVDSYGGATSYGNASPSGTMPSGAPVVARSIEAHPVDDGYWVLWSDGTVEEFGDCAHHGNAGRIGFEVTEYVGRIRSTHTGNGYWILSGGGIVQAFGDAPSLGNAPRYPAEKWVLGICWDMIQYSLGTNGYAVQYADGNLAFEGDFEYFGSIGAGSGQLRLDGNYKDYADIVKDLLLWSGWMLYPDAPLGSDVYLPDQATSRQHMAEFIYRYNGSPAFSPVGQSFIDVPPNHESYVAIEWCFDQNIFVGYSSWEGSRFRPSQEMHRSDVAAALYVEAGSPPFLPTSPSFSDVPPEHPRYLEIEWVADQGFMDFLAGTQFGPDEVVTRGEMAKLLYIYDGSPAYSAPGSRSFSDVGRDDEWYFWVEWLNDEGVATSFTNAAAIVPTDASPQVYGGIESTGAFAKECLPQDMFDKRPVMDAIRQIKEVVGYIFYVDQEGGARFESPNWWGLGNFSMSGTPIDQVPEIDELVQLTSYDTKFADGETRSEIIVASADPTADQKDTVVSRVVPQNVRDLKGIVKPAMWTNGAFADPQEQRVMADLIAMHTWFARRQSNVECVANPLIGINDQVRIFERQTGEVYIHYVRGVSFNHDLVSGDFTMSLSTHWLGGSPHNRPHLFFACAPHPSEAGYWQVDAGGSIWAFGEAEYFDKNESDSHIEPVVAMRSTPTGEGYYTLDVSGKIVTYGDAVHRGDLSRSTNDVRDFALSPTGDGYYVVLEDGTIHVFGDALYFGDASPTGNMPSGSPVVCHSIESHPSVQGYWVLWSDGTVEEFNLVNHGSADRIGFQPTEYVGVMRRTRSGDGYWILSGNAIMQAFGGAIDEGDGDSYPVERWVFGLCWDFIPDYTPGASGYAIQHADGKLDAIGDFDHQGDAGGGNRKLRREVTWALTNDPSEADGKFVVSNDVMKFMVKASSRSAMNAVVGNFGAEQDVTLKARTT